MSTAPDRDRDLPEDPDWVTVETLVRGTIAAEIRCKDNYVSGHPPLYSLRVGRARITPEATVWISPHMSIYDLHVACELIDELGEKYRGLRLQQSGRRVVDKKRLTVSRDGVLEAKQQVTKKNSSRYYDGGSED